MFSTPLYAALALCAVTSRVCVATEALVLLQRGADLIDKNVVTGKLKQLKLHAIEDEFTKSLGAWDTTDERMMKLQDNLKQDKLQVVSAIAQEKEAYEKNVNNHQELNAREVVVNNHLRESIESLRRENTRLRSEARNLANASDALVKDIAAVRYNITTVASFLAGVLDESYALLGNDSKLEVLRILDQEDEESEQAAQRTAELTEVQTGGIRATAMLQTGAYLREPTPDPQGMLEAMVSALSSVTRAQDQTEAAMREHYEAELEELFSVGHQLKAEQFDLNATRATEVTRQQRLIAAVRHLRDAHKRLLDQSRALRTFAESLDEKKELVQAAQERAKATATPAPPAVAEQSLSVTGNAAKAQPNMSPTFRAWATGFFSSAMEEEIANMAMEAVAAFGHHSKSAEAEKAPLAKAAEPKTGPKRVKAAEAKKAPTAKAASA